MTIRISGMTHTLIDRLTRTRHAHTNITNRLLALGAHHVKAKGADSTTVRAPAPPTSPMPNLADATDRE